MRIPLLAIVVTANVLAAQGNVSACFNPDSAWPAAKTFAVAPRCMKAWADSLHATDRQRQGISRGMLALIGGRQAVDALKADYEATHSPVSMSLMMSAMASNGSPEDIAFLKAQLSAPDTGMAWPRVQTAALAMGMLRVTDARDTLRAIKARSRPSTFVQRAAEWALEVLDLPPCVDSVTASGSALDKELLRIVMECRPPVLGKNAVYADAASGRVWQFTNDTWRARARQPSDTLRGTIAADVMLVPEQDIAFVRFSMDCGMLCGEGWTFRLRRTGSTWRVLSLNFDWVS